MSIDKPLIHCTGFESDAREIRENAIDFSIGLRIMAPRLLPSEVAELQAEILRDFESLLEEKYKE